jgi:uncharacterized protein (DUF4213/DUF364 family)
LDKWLIYHQLLSTMDENVKVADIFCGITWTAVLSDAGDLGMAMTTASYGIEKSSEVLIGKPLKQVAELVKSWNFYDAGIGMAAINAYYNTSTRLKANDWSQPNKEFCTFGLDLKDKTISMIGHLRHEEGLFAEAKAVNIIEYHPRIGDYPATACEYLLPQSDIVIITASSFVNKTLPRLLELSQNAFTIVCGPTTPMHAKLVNAFSIDRLAGFIPTDVKEILSLLKSNALGSPYAYGERFCLDK